MRIERVVVAGAGVLGSQIAFQAAFHGHAVAVYDQDPDTLQQLQHRFAKIAGKHRVDLGADSARLDQALSRIVAHDALDAAGVDADLVIEAIPDLLAVKKTFLAEVGAVLPAESVVASNSSGFVPSQLAGHYRNPERYLHLHFSNQIWKHNVAEVMGGPETDPQVVDTVVEFARSIGMVPILIEKEHPGYVGNALLGPLLRAALELVIDGVADYRTVDKNWMITRETPMGPFGMFDHIGIGTIYARAQVAHAADPSPRNRQILDYWRLNFVEQGKMGEQSGEGFYRYPDPEFARPEFLT